MSYLGIVYRGGSRTIVKADEVMNIQADSDGSYNVSTLSKPYIGMIDIKYLMSLNIAVSWLKGKPE